MFSTWMTALIAAISLVLIAFLFADCLSPAASKFPAGGRPDAKAPGNRSLAVLAGGVAHDFNNLLTVIIGNASLARESLEQIKTTPALPTEFPQQIADSLEQIEIASNLAANLCRHMLTYAGKGRFTLQPANLNDVIASTAKLVEQSIDPGIRFSISASRKPLIVEADPSYLQQVILNLTINASEAIISLPTRHGLPGKPADVRNGWIQITTSPEIASGSEFREARVGAGIPGGEFARIDISDNGCGMDEATLAHIFDPFFTTKFTGRGLGLAATLGIVRAHNGALLVQSTPGKGSVFSLFLPLKPNASVAPQTSLGSPRTRFATGTILIVDDEPAVRKVAASIVERQGYTAALAADGYEALALALAHGMHYKAVILDCTMPGLDGIATLKELRAMHKTVPILMTSGCSENIAIEKQTRDPHLRFLQKPFTYATLVDQLDRLILEKQSHSA